MQGQAQPLIILAVFILLVIIGAALYITGTGSDVLNATSEEPTPLSRLSVSFSIEGTDGNMVFLRNNGRDSITQGAITVLANGHPMKYSIPTPIEGGKTGFIVLEDLEPGQCDTTIDIRSRLVLDKIGTTLCLLFDDFSTGDAWTGEVENGELHATSAAPAYSKRKIAFDSWVLDARIKGDTPQIAFQTEGERGYKLQLKEENSLTQASFRTGERTTTAYTYDFTFEPTSWYKVKISYSDGFYFAKVWKDGTREPSVWRLFLTDAAYKSGSIGLTSATGDAYMDDVTLSLPQI